MYGPRVKQWIMILVVVAAVLGAGVIAYGELRPKSDLERIQEACGTDPMHLASIMDDGSVCCDLCAGTSSA